VNANTINIFDAYDAELLAQHDAITPEQRAMEDQKREAQRQAEARSTAIETEAQRLDPEEYPIDNA